MLNFIKSQILKYPYLLPFIKKLLKTFRIRKNDRLINKINKHRSNYASWVEQTIQIHNLYNIKKRKYIYDNNDIYFQSDYNVYFKYINNFGLRNLEFNGTNDRLQLEFILKHLNENTVVFDIGANYGYYCLTIAKNISGSNCFAFEPSKVCVDTLHDNIKINQLKNVMVNDSAVGSDIGFGMGMGKKNKFGVQYVSSGNSPDQSDFNMITIDSFVNEYKITNIDFIKIDIEGAELLALNGGKKSIAKFRPIVQCELSNNFTIPRYNYSIADVYNYFNSLNYIYAYISKENALYESRGLEWSTGSFEKDANNSYEFFFIPNEMKSSIDLSTQFKNSILKPYAV